jgi:hypothetical protein
VHPASAPGSSSVHSGAGRVKARNIVKSYGGLQRTVVGRWPGISLGGKVAIAKSLQEALLAVAFTRIPLTLIRAGAYLHPFAPRSRVPAIAQEASMLAFHAALITSSLSLTGY